MECKRQELKVRHSMEIYVNQGLTNYCTGSCGFSSQKRRNPFNCHAEFVVWYGHVCDSMAKQEHLKAHLTSAIIGEVL